MKKLAYLSILLGIAILAYPYVNEQIQNHKEKLLLEKFNDSFSKTSVAIQVSPRQFQQLGHTVVNEVQPPRQLSAASKSMLSGAIALITIDKIDLVLPILEGASNENMKHAATHISETSAFGEVGNVGIAAHRARTPGRLFNRLDELAIGDKILIRKMNKDFTYTVFKTFIVKPDDVTVLNHNNVDSILTLVTCTYIGEETDRLIVQAKLD
jgi:sortase A